MAESKGEVRRGRAHDAAGAREAILDAAEKVFAEHGFDGARIDAIAVESSYNKSLIFQYFGDKLGLYAEVIRRADEQTRAMQTEILTALVDDQVMSDAHKLQALFEKALNDYFDYLAAHPQIVRIYLWEMAEGWQTYGKVISPRDYEDIAQFTPVLHKLQGRGWLRSDIDPILQVSMGVFMGLFYLGLVPIYNFLPVPGLDLSSGDALARGRTFVTQFVVHGLMADLPEAKP